MKLNTAHADLDLIAESFEHQEAQQRMQRAASREGKRKKRMKPLGAPMLGDLLAPGVPNDMLLVTHDLHLRAFMLQHR